MKKKLSLGLVLMLGASLAKADPWGDFNRFANSGNVGAYTQDIGGILGSGTYHTARGLGFDGFDAGFHVAFQPEPGAHDGIMKLSNVKGFGMPWFQAEIGLPLKFDGFIRGFSYGGMTVAGGGLRYALFTIQDARGVPQLLLVGDGESFAHQSFAGSHFGLGLVASAKYETFQPYIGVGVDRTRLVPTQALDASILGSVFIQYAYRASLGVTMRPFQFAYLHLAATMMYKSPGASAGFGVRF